MIFEFKRKYISSKKQKNNNDVTLVNLSHVFFTSSLLVLDYVTLQISSIDTGCITEMYKYRVLCIIV